MMQNLMKLTENKKIAEILVDNQLIEILEKVYVDYEFCKIKLVVKEILINLVNHNIVTEKMIKFSLYILECREIGHMINNYDDQLNYPNIISNIAIILLKMIETNKEKWMEHLAINLEIFENLYYMEILLENNNSRNITCDWQQMKTEYINHDFKNFLKFIREL